MKPWVQSMGSYPIELGAITPMFYAFRERETLQEVMTRVRPIGLSSIGECYRPPESPQLIAQLTARER